MASCWTHGSYSGKVCPGCAELAKPRDKDWTDRPNQKTWVNKVVAPKKEGS